jgi:hypothetical protein
VDPAAVGGRNECSGNVLRGGEESQRALTEITIDGGRRATLMLEKTVSGDPMDTELIRELGLERELDRQNATKATSRSIPTLDAANEQERPAALRSAVVTMGPAAALDVALGASVVGVAIDALARTAATPARTALRRAAVIGSLAAWGYTTLVRPWMQGWGASDRELRSTLPGDGIIARPTGETTRAVTVDAPASCIWPWLLQLGQGRGGFYSYDWLESLAGLDIHSTDEVLPQYQRLMVGDEVPFGNGVAIPVLRVEQERALVIGASIDLTTGKPFDPTKRSAPRFVSMTWAFVLRPIHDAATRLVARFRVEERPRGLMPGAYPLFIELPHFVMERRMLLGIRDRAERLFAATCDGDDARRRNAILPYR